MTETDKLTSTMGKTPEKKPKIAVDWDWNSWQAHAINIMVIVVVLQIILTTIKTLLPWIFEQFQILTLNTNVIALVYAVFMYAIIDRARQAAAAKMRAEGVETIDFENAVGQIAIFTKKMTDFEERNRSVLEAIGAKMENADLNELFKFGDSVAQIARLLAEMGWNAETLERVKPALIQMAAVGPKFADLLPEIAKLLAVTDTEKLKNSLVTMRVMMETNGATTDKTVPHSESEVEK